jgi:HSP90 family molecular chaperone
MAEFQLQIAGRQIRRQFARAIGKNIPKILTELITNADDSYRRLEDGSNAGDADRTNEPVPITIIFERGKRTFRVVGNAEGLTDKDMEERFVTYGQESRDRQRGFKTRSLFGKGLRDVLFTQY